MIDSDNINLDAIIDVQSEHYRNELVALFKSCAISTIIASMDKTIIEIKKLAQSGCKQTMYITDKVDEKKLKEHELIPSIRIENLLLVDEETKDKIVDSEGLEMLYLNLLKVYLKF